jgi:OmpR family response regulator RpaB
MTNILLIEDDNLMAARLSRYFKHFDLHISHAQTPMLGLEMLAQQSPKLVLLDIMLPQMNGFEVCRRIRAKSEIPIIMLTARGELSDKVLGLELGADDYLDKPFEPRELVARIQRILRRITDVIAQESDPAIWMFEHLVISPKQHRVELNNNVLNLTGMEFQLLCLMAQSPGEVFSRDEILNRLKGFESDVFSRSVDILVSRLRQKLGDTAKQTQFIKTIRNAGYSFIAMRL